MNDKISKTPADMIPDGEQGHIFPNGIFYRKGTTTATHQNAEEYQQIILKPQISSEDEEKITQLINDQRLLTNMLRYGMYIDQFPLNEWFSDHQYEGKMMPALLLLIQFPDLMTKDIHNQLMEIKKSAKKPTVDLIEKAIKAYDEYLSSKNATHDFLVLISKKHIHALSSKDIDFIKKVWFEGGSLIVPGEPEPIHGKEAIINFTQKNFDNFKHHMARSLC